MVKEVPARGRVGHGPHVGTGSAPSGVTAVWLSPGVTGPRSAPGPTPRDLARRGLSGAHVFCPFLPGAQAGARAEAGVESPCGWCGAGSPVPRHLGWGISQPDVSSQISFPLSGSGEGDSFLSEGPSNTSNGCLFSETLHTRAIFCLDSLRKFAIALSGLFLFFPPFLIVAKQPIFLTEAPTVSCFLSPLLAHCLV